MLPKSLCMCYFFVDALAHCIKNALFVECVSASTEKSSVYMHSFFCRCTGALHKNIHYLWNASVHLQKSSAYTSFRETFQINLVTETCNRHPKPETKTIQNASLFFNKVNFVLSLSGIIFVWYGNWFSRLEQVHNAPKFPTAIRGWESIYKWLPILSTSINFSPRAVYYFWKFSFLNGKWLPAPLLVVFRISFWPIREWPIELNPNCSVNWLTAQKGKISSIFCNPIGQFSVAICKAICGFWWLRKIPLGDVTFEDSHQLWTICNGTFNSRIERKCLRKVLLRRSSGYLFLKRHEAQNTPRPMTITMTYSFLSTMLSAKQCCT